MRLFRPVAPSVLPAKAGPTPLAPALCFAAAGILMILIGVYLVLGLGVTLILLGFGSCFIGIEIYKIQQDAKAPRKIP